MSDRKKIVKILTGSRLYGTFNSGSDHDYLGVFLPSTDDMFSLQNSPKEWSESEKVSDGPRNTKDDTDYKSYSLQRFFKLLGEGQPGALELLFAPPENVIFSTHEWDEICARSKIFISKMSVRPFIGFALSQAHKAVIKGDNLNKILALINYIGSFEPEDLRLPLSNHVEVKWDMVQGCEVECIGSTEVLRKTNDYGATVIEIAGRQYDQNVRTKSFLSSLKELEGRYGGRTRASAEMGIDPKFLMHAYRQINQAKELMATGAMTFPRPEMELDLYRQIKTGEYQADFFAELTAGIDEIRQVLEPKSDLPATADWKAINRLCQNMLRRHLL